MFGVSYAEGIAQPEGIQTGRIVYLNSQRPVN